MDERCIDMARITKDPDVRKQELIDTAEQLFIKRGYDEVSVADIVKKARVAQGTFYYYFRSKDEVRDAIIEKNIREVKQIMDEVVADGNLSAIEKMGAFSRRFRQWSADHGKVMDYIHEKKNEVIHYRMSRRVLEHMAVAYTRMIEQGNREGVFHAEHPDLAALAVLGITEAVLGEDHHGLDLSTEDGRRRGITLLRYSEMILGTKPGTFTDLAGIKG
jgi:AcrR family transcriptional regulator